MKLGDFSSLVQLGVGLHAGTAILQIFGDIGMGSINHRILLIKNWIADPKNTSPKKDAVCEEISESEAVIEIFREDLFFDYRQMTFVNLYNSISLSLILIIISFNYDENVDFFTAIIVSLYCFLFPVVSFLLIWIKASRGLHPISRSISRIEDYILS